VEVAEIEKALAEEAAADDAEGAAANKRAARRYRQIGALAFLQDTQKAMDAYAKAVELDPDDPDGWNRLGQLQLCTGALDAATSSVGRVLALGNKTRRKDVEATATGNLGLIYQRRGELDRAEKLGCRSVDLAREVGTAYLGSWLCLSRKSTCGLSRVDACRGWPRRRGPRIAQSDQGEGRTF